ncbi:DEAD/DEAH box helicase [Nocardia thailandica]
MGRNEERDLAAVRTEVAEWVGRAEQILAGRAAIAHDANSAAIVIRRGTVDLQREDRHAWRLITLRSSDGPRLTSIARHTQLPTMSRDVDRQLTRLLTDGKRLVSQAAPTRGLQRIFTSKKKREASQAAAEALIAYRDSAADQYLPQLLNKLMAQNNRQIADVRPAQALADHVGLAAHMTEIGPFAQLLTTSVVRKWPTAVWSLSQAASNERRAREAAVKAGDAMRRNETRRMLAEMPVDRLREATLDKLRIGPLTDAGITTVQAVLEHGTGLDRLPGIGATTATRILGAARTLWQTTYDEMPTRIDIKARATDTTAFLRSLRLWEATRRAGGSTTALALAESMSALTTAVDRHIEHIVAIPVSHPIAELERDIDTVLTAAASVSAAADDSKRDPWADFLSRPADYFAMLAELGFLTEDEQKTHGELPEEIITAVRETALDVEYLSASLRGYQSFAARFALVQRKVIIGDEMGLGKTVEALAVLAHLRAKGDHHALVICPAAVVTNWIREIEAKSRLRAHRLHGRERDTGFRNWVRNGGVAVTTFDTLHWLVNTTVSAPQLGAVIVDEAHMIKNPATKRAQRTAAFLDIAEHAVLLTGTPLENRLDEFRNLVRYLRPDLVLDGNENAPRRFRKEVAPAYLRRNQEDVLTELPERVEVQEWTAMSRGDFAQYRAAVGEGNFAAMRQAALLHRDSAKLQRLLEIVEEAEDNGRRVLIFSEFRKVLDQVKAALPGKVFGPITGSVPAGARQDIVDEFARAEHGAALVAQIVAGGVGLNIQAASVVVICEPSLKPTVEWQAIARAHRMGQLHSVQVHRLLSEEGVDQRITEILARKQQTFDDFARVSATANSAPEAFDISEADIARDIVAEERQRLLAQPVE